MPVANIIDNRTNHYKVDVSIVYEFSWQDNCINGATQFTEEDYLCKYIETTTISYAIAFANQNWPENAITLFLHDIGYEDYKDHDTINIKNGIYILE